MSDARIAVLQFPGLNCEDETLRVLHFAGLDADLVRWNDSGRRLADFAGFVIPGGFSYQDRVRAGAIAAKSPLMDALTREAEKGKPVLGICNGAQILVEAGLAPGRTPGRVDVAMAHNRVPHREGYNSCWVFVRAGRRARCFFTEDLDEPLPVVIGHAEGRFLSRDPDFAAWMEDPERRTLLYCDSRGEPAKEYPDNPNGSPGALAGVAGLEGQVLAFMPPPERAAWLWQVPEDLEGAWGRRRRAAVGQPDIGSRPGPGLRMIEMFRRLQKSGSV